jgi:hypothetical protein
MLPGISCQAGFQAKMREKIFWLWELFPYLRQEGSAGRFFAKNHPIDIGTELF